MVFEEEQRFGQIWLWILMGLVWLVPALGFMWPEKLGMSSSSSEGLILANFLVLGTIWVLYRMKLRTRIDSEGITVRLTFFPQRIMAWSDIEKMEVIQYDFLGYGYRISSKYGKVYNMSGNWGLQIILKNGKKYLFGTQKPDELRLVIKKQHLNP